MPTNDDIGSTWEQKLDLDYIFVVFCRFVLGGGYQTALDSVELLERLSIFLIIMSGVSISLCFNI